MVKEMHRCTILQWWKIQGWDIRTCPEQNVLSHLLISLRIISHWQSRPFTTILESSGVSSGKGIHIPGSIFMVSNHARMAIPDGIDADRYGNTPV